MKLSEINRPEKTKTLVWQPEERQETGEQDATHWYQKYHRPTGCYKQSQRTGPYPEGYDEAILKESYHTFDQKLTEALATRQYTKAFIDPDDIYTSGSITFAYTTSGHLYTAAYDATHHDLPRLHKELEAELAQGGGYRLGRGAMREDYFDIGALIGRAFQSQQIVSFWNKDEQDYNDLLKPLLDELLSRGMVDGETRVYTPIRYNVNEKVGNFPTVNELLGRQGAATSQSLSPEEEKAILSKLHLMPGPEKQLALKKLGAIGQADKWRDTRQELYDTEKDPRLLYPAWRATSEQHSR